MKKKIISMILMAAATIGSTMGSVQAEETISSLRDYGDFEVVDQENNEFDYSNEGRIRYIQMAVANLADSLGTQQLFRNYDGDGYVDLVQVRRFYDTNNDGVRESMSIWNDRDMDGEFEDQYSYDGTIFDNSLWD